MSKKKKKNEYQEMIGGCDIHLNREERKGSGRREKKAGT